MEDLDRQFRRLIPWTQLTRTEMPEFEVIRLPLEAVPGTVLQPGDRLPRNAFADRHRFRQMYEQRRIAPIVSVQPVPEVTPPGLVLPAASDGVTPVASKKKLK